MTFARRQRHQLLDLMREVGPLAATACEGWQVQDLAAHLWIREHRPSALPGIGIKRFAGRTQRLQQENLHRLGFERIVEDLERPAGVFALLDPFVNAAEFYLHHEDVRRPLGEKVPLTDEERAAFKPMVMLLARKAQLGKDHRLVVTPSGGHTASFGSGERVVYVEGPMNELLLHFSGRDGEVVVTADDEDAYRASLRGL